MYKSCSQETVLEEEITNNVVNIMVENNNTNQSRTADIFNAQFFPWNEFA